MTINIINDSVSCLTAEGQAAVQLKDMLTASIPEEIEGQIYIASNVKHLYNLLWLINIDILVRGEFSNCILPHYYSLEDKGPKKDLVVKDFLILFDLKSHQADRVSCKDSQILVKYSNKTQNISHRIDLQRDHLVAALNSEHTNVIASDAIWLNSVTKEELSKITSGQNVNALPNEFEFKDLIDTILAQGVKPTYDEVNDCYVLSAGISMEELDSEMTFLLQDMGVFDAGYSDNEYDALPEENENELEKQKQRYAEAEAKAKDYFYNKKYQTVDIIKLNGSVELGPIVELSDVIVDIVETGSTLRENGLEVLEEICPISSRLIVNRVSLKMQKERIEKLVEDIKINL